MSFPDRNSESTIPCYLFPSGLQGMLISNVFHDHFLSLLGTHLPGRGVTMIVMTTQQNQSIKSYKPQYIMPL